MQIYKIYEMETKILSNLKTYKNNKNPNDYEKKEYLKNLEHSKEIINFKKNEEKKEMNNNPEFDDIKVFSDEIIRN